MNFGRPKLRFGWQKKHIHLADIWLACYTISVPP